MLVVIISFVAYLLNYNFRFIIKELMNIFNKETLKVTAMEYDYAEYSLYQI